MPKTFEPGDRCAIGIAFGNSNSSIAYTVDDKAEVIANEDGGEIIRNTCNFISFLFSEQ